MEGLWLASAGDDIKLWDCEQGFALLNTFNPQCNRNIASVSWNFDGSLLASCALESEQVTLTFAKTFTTIELPCGAGVQCIDFSSSSRTLVCGGVEGVSVWDLKTKTLKKSFKEHKGPVSTVRYNWNNSYIASGSETGEIILHNTLTGQSSSPLVAPSVQAIRQLEYSSFKKSMFGTASDDGAVTLWDANTRRLLHSFKNAHVGPATGLAFSPINEKLMMSVGLDKRFVCYDIQRKQILKVFDAESPLTCIDIMPDGATAAVGSTRGKVYVYDLRQGGSIPIHIFQAHKTSVHSVKCLPVAKSNKEDLLSGVKTSVSSTSGSRRQLPSAPTVMQDITPSKTGQTSDTEPVPQFRNSPTPTMDVFSPTTAQENLSHQHSRSASHINLTASRGEDSFSGVFSPLSRGAGNLSAISQSGYKDISLLSMPSFLGQNNSNTEHMSFHNTEHMSFHNTEQPSLHNNTSNAATKTSGKGHHQSLLQHSLTNQRATGHPLSANTTGEHLSHVTAGHLSPLQQSGTVLSPMVGHISHPQLCSSLQGSVTEGLVVPGTGQVGSSAGQVGLCGGGTQGPYAPSSQQGLTVSDIPNNNSRGSASPDSAAISGGEEGEGLSPARNSSSSLPPVRQTNGVAWMAAGPVDMGGASGEAGTTQREFLRSLVSDAMEDVRDDLHRDIQGLHVAMLKQFHNFEREMHATLSHYAQENQKLMLYVKELEEENRRLKKNY